MTDALTKSGGVPGRSVTSSAVFADPRLYLLIVVGLMTYTMQQNGYRAASLRAFLPAFAVLDPVVGSVLGLTIYHERLDGGAIRIGIEAVAVIAATWGIARLAKSSAAQPIVRPTAQPAAEPVPAGQPASHPTAEPALAQPEPVPAGPVSLTVAACQPGPLPVAVAVGQPEPVPEPVPAAGPGHISGLLASHLPLPTMPDLSPPSIATD